MPVESLRDNLRSQIDAILLEATETQLQIVLQFIRGMK